MSTFPKPPEIFSHRYQLLEYLGSGGVGTVFKALQIDADREVAIKIMNKQFSQNEEFKKRFIREARALSQLKHSSIVTVYHIGVSDEGNAFMVMELLQGKSLRQVLNQIDKIPSLQALKIAMQTAEALACVHENGIVHRDLKPENIISLETPEPDTVKLIDFGLARMSDEQNLTQSGVLIGTVSYMSPEQCKGQAADARSDIYSLCACLYEMLCGQKLFDAENPVGVMYKHMHDPYAPISKTQVDRFDESINMVLQKGLEKLPENRFQSMNELLAALFDLNSTLEKTEASTVSGKLNARRTAIVAAATIVALLAASGAFSIYQTSQQNKNAGWKPELPGSLGQTQVASNTTISGSTAVVIVKRADEIFSKDIQKATAFLDKYLSSKRLKPRARIILLNRRGQFENSPKKLDYASESYKLATQELAKGDDLDSNHLFFGSAYFYASTLFIYEKYKQVLAICDKLINTSSRSAAGLGQSRLSAGVPPPSSSDILILAANAARRLGDLKLANHYADKLREIDFGGFRNANMVCRLLFDLKRVSDVERYIDLINLGFDQPREARMLYEYEAFMDFHGLCAVAVECESRANWALAQRALERARQIQHFAERSIPGGGIGVKWQIGILEAELLYAKGDKKAGDKRLSSLAGEWLKYNKEEPSLKFEKNNPISLIIKLLQNGLSDDAHKVIKFAEGSLLKYAPHLEFNFGEGNKLEANRTRLLQELAPFQGDKTVLAFINKIKEFQVQKEI